MLISTLRALFKETKIEILYWKMVHSIFLKFKSYNSNAKFIFLSP